MNATSLGALSAQKVLDVRGLSWPLPITKTLRALEYTQKGEILEIWSFGIDLEQELVERSENGGYVVLKSIADTEGYLRIFIRKDAS